MSSTIDREFVQKTLVAYAIAQQHNTAQSAPSSLRHWLEDYREALTTRSQRRATAQAICRDTGMAFDGDAFDRTDLVLELFIDATLKYGGAVLNRSAPEAFAIMSKGLTDDDPALLAIVDAIATVASEGAG